MKVRANGQQFSVFIFVFSSKYTLKKTVLSLLLGIIPFPVIPMPASALVSL